MKAAAGIRPRKTATPAFLVDSDVHNKMPASELAARLPRRWRRRYEDYGFNLGSAAGYTRPRSQGAMTNSWPPGGGLPGSDREFMTRQLLDRWGHTFAILNPIDQVFFGGQYGEYGAALDRALNEWLAEEWLAPDPRLYGSISVPFEEPDLAVAEIERWSEHPRFLQVLLNLVTRDPLGNRRYWPVYEAAAGHGLPVAIHVAGTSGRPKSSAGWLSSYFEDHAGYSLTFLEQLISLVAEGVFERFPTLRIVFQEGGFTWLPALLWRLDRAFGLLRDDLPHLELTPSEYCRRQLWFTTQPIEEPERPADFLWTLQRLQMDDRLLFATDYPHWDFDSPDQSLPPGLAPGLKERIFWRNALDLYDRLPRPDREPEP